VYTPDFFVAKQHGLRNTTSWWSIDIASGFASYTGGGLSSQVNIMELLETTIPLPHLFLVPVLARGKENGADKHVM
jgi:hypothetical protein